PMGSQVGDDHKGHAQVGRHGLEQMLERFNAPGGGAYANDWKWPIHRLPPSARGGTSACDGRIAKFTPRPGKFKAALSPFRCAPRKLQRETTTFAVAAAPRYWPPARRCVAMTCKSTLCRDQG